MVSILCSWLIIFFFSFIYGKTITCLVYKNRTAVLEELDVFIVCGMMFLNVYAQYISLFHKVGALAFYILVAGAIGCIMFLGITKEHKGIKVNMALGKVRWLLLSVSIAATLLWTNIVPQHYDTYLYHAQAVRWIEEYGVVPGLGNLHFRFAYNSAFLPLQALFSFQWIFGISLHTVNGFLVSFILIFIFSQPNPEKGERFYTSNLLKFGMIFYIVVSCYNISSPNTDMWPMLLVLYICMKWSRFSEQGIEDPIPYGFLCILGVYAVTLKLSVATFLMLTIYPVIVLIRRKQWIKIGWHLRGGILIALPYLVRNVIISGYLVYPYPEINLFDFDWKMPVEKLVSDRREIMAWGRGIKDPERYDAVFREWFPEWLGSVHPVWKVLLIITLIATIAAVLYLLKNLIQKKMREWDVLVITCIAGSIYWFFTAPLPRYGVVFMLLISCIILPKVIESVIKSYKARHRILMLVNGMGIFAVCFYFGFFFFYSKLYGAGGIRGAILQEDYDNRSAEKIVVNGAEFYVPSEGDQGGYDPFPSAPGISEDMYLRGATWEDGFAKGN